MNNTKFPFTWSNENGTNKRPDAITFPDGTIKTVQFMRDGIIRFVRAGTATYQRAGDRRIIVTPIETAAQMGAALRIYRQRNSPKTP